MRALLDWFYKGLLLAACLSMVTAFVSIMLGVVAREANWDIPGLDAYAGYAIAATLFLALPSALRNGDHIRVTLLLQKLPHRPRNVLEFWCLSAGLFLSGYLAWFSCRLVMTSYLTHDVSQSMDVTPLWIPQLSMALGCIGFTLVFFEALLARLQGRQFFAHADDHIANIE
jgi:TRAP-type C4-dicarboxylate transport system permease small subunit